MLDSFDLLHDQAGRFVELPVLTGQRSINRTWQWPSAYNLRGVEMFTLAAFLLSVTLILNAPLLVLVFVGRRRLAQRLCAALVAAGFGAAAAYMIWRLEWFDVWRNGRPSVEYLLTGPLPWVAAFGIAGWHLGQAIAVQGGRTPTAEEQSRVISAVPWLAPVPQPRARTGSQSRARAPR